MDDEAVKKLIKRHEGYRERVYVDSVGVPTVGYGHAFHERSKIPRKAIDIIFEQDFKDVLSDYDLLGLDLDPVRRAVILDMLFNLGILKLRRFKNTLRSIRKQHYGNAAVHMIDSKWARQVGPRATRLAKMMATGEYN